MADHLYISDNDTIKFEYEGKRYCVCIKRDTCGSDPRGDGDNTSIMACWHGRYKLGDDIGGKSPKEFWNDLVEKYVPDKQFVKQLMADNLLDSHIWPSSGQEDEIRAENKLYDFYDLDYSKAEPLGEGIPFSELGKLKCDLSIRDCMTLLQEYCEWEPLWLYDHSGLSISAGGGYPYNDRWDSGQVGWAVVRRKDLPDNLSDHSWRNVADDIIDDETEIYDYYLRDEVYGYTLYEAQSDDSFDPEWEEIEESWGFFGDDLARNGMLDCIPGLFEAVTTDKFECGTAHKYTVSKTYYEF